jgi:hypothetical protein
MRTEANHPYELPDDFWAQKVRKSVEITLKHHKGKLPASPEKIQNVALELSDRYRSKFLGTGEFGLIVDWEKTNFGPLYFVYENKGGQFDINKFNISDNIDELPDPNSVLEIFFDEGHARSMAQKMSLVRHMGKHKKG